MKTVENLKEQKKERTVEVGIHDYRNMKNALKRQKKTARILRELWFIYSKLREE